MGMMNIEQTVRNEWPGQGMRQATEEDAASVYGYMDTMSDSQEASTRRLTSPIHTPFNQCCSLTYPNPSTRCPRRRTAEMSKRSSEGVAKPAARGASVRAMGVPDVKAGRLPFVFFTAQITNLCG